MMNKQLKNNEKYFSTASSNEEVISVVVKSKLGDNIYFFLSHISNY